MKHALRVKGKVQNKLKRNSVEIRDTETGETLKTIAHKDWSVVDRSVGNVLTYEKNGGIWAFGFYSRAYAVLTNGA